jgi:hypothetical protein
MQACFSMIAVTMMSASVFIPCKKLHEGVGSERIVVQGQVERKVLQA